jgi:hypothetical protein
LLSLFGAVQYAQAGAIRYAGKQIGKGSVMASQTAADAAGGVATAGKATGGAVKTGVVAAGKVAAAAPRLAVRGTKAAGKALARAIW